MRTLLDQLSMVSGVKFASFTYRTKGTGELSRYLVNLGVNITNLYRQDVETLSALLPSLDGIDRIAADEILASLNVSLDKGVGNNPDYTHGKNSGDTYAHLDIPNVKLNKNDGSLHLFDVVLVSKTVLEEGTYKEVKSSDKTLAKRKLEKNLRKSKIRQFALSGITVAKLNGQTLEFA